MKNNDLPQCPPVTEKFLSHIFGNIDEAVKTLGYLLLTSSKTKRYKPIVLIYSEGIPSGKGIFSKWLIYLFDIKTYPVKQIQSDDFTYVFGGIHRANCQVAIVDFPSLELVEAISKEAGHSLFRVNQAMKAPVVKSTPKRYIVTTHQPEVAKKLIQEVVHSSYCTDALPSELNDNLFEKLILEGEEFCHFFHSRVA